MIRALALGAALLAGTAAAEEFPYVGDNHAWKLACNASGYVLTSRDPVVRFHEGGANSRVTDQVETLYLGRSCDAFHPVLGTGTWCWANGGFRAEIAGEIIGFPRQELSCPDGSAITEYDCGC